LRRCSSRDPGIIACARALVQNGCLRRFHRRGEVVRQSQPFAPGVLRLHCRCVYAGVGFFARENTAEGNGAFGFSLSSSSDNTLKENAANGNDTADFNIFACGDPSFNNTLKKNLAQGNLAVDAVWR